MSADSLRKGAITKVPGHSVRPQAVSEKTFMESVAGLINEVGLAPQPYGHSDESEGLITWAKLECQKSPEVKLGENVSTTKLELNQQSHPMLLTVGYSTGVQAWAVNANGESNEVLSWKRPSVKLLQFLPNPTNENKDVHRNSRPIAAICEGSNSANFVSFISLRTGETLKSSKYVQAVLDIMANGLAIAVSFLDKIIVLDPCTLETRVTISQLGMTPTAPTHNPMTLGHTWLAYTDRRLFPRYQSTGGLETGETLSYTASMLYAAKSFTKGLKGLGETVASSITGHRVPGKTETVVSEPGIVTVVNLMDLKPGEFCLSDTSTGNSAMHAPVIAHFMAHRNNPVTAMSFDSSGMLLVTADKQGHDFNVFRIHPHPLSSSLGTVQHLYVLHRGDTVAKVQNISFAPDSRWVAISTLRGTTHVFPITPYGGPISARTHATHKVVNRLSRFHRTAGLDDATTSGRHSPVTTFGGNPQGSLLPAGMKAPEISQPPSAFPIPPQFLHPITITPMAQLRQDGSGNSSSSSPRSSPPVTKAKTFLQDDKVIVVSMFGEPRSQSLYNPSVSATCDKRKKPAVDSLFVMTCYGNLIEYALEPRPSPVDAVSRSSVHGKISDDTAIELLVHAKVQWRMIKPSFAKELQPPLQPNNILISICSGADLRVGCKKSSFESDENVDERWLSQVEITTHHGPHRRLWMGPQFTFKVLKQPSLSGIPKGETHHDIETVEVNVTNRPARSNPVNMPVYSSLLPFVIEDSSGSSLEQSPRLADPYCQSDAVMVNSDSLIKENIAEAMMENSSLNPRDKGGCQSQGLGSCDDLSSGSSIDSSSQASGDAPFVSSYCIDAGFPFPD